MTIKTALVISSCLTSPILISATDLGRREWSKTWSTPIWLCLLPNAGQRK